MKSTFPRRNRLDLNTPAEKAIFSAMQEVEKAGAHPLLTEAVILLGKAKDLISDYVDMGVSSDLDTTPESGHIEDGLK